MGQENLTYVCVCVDTKKSCLSELDTFVDSFNWQRDSDWKIIVKTYRRSSKVTKNTIF